MNCHLEIYHLRWPNYRENSWQTALIPTISDWKRYLLHLQILNHLLPKLREILFSLLKHSEHSDQTTCQDQQVRFAKSAWRQSGRMALYSWAVLYFLSSSRASKAHYGFHVEGPASSGFQWMFHNEQLRSWREFKIAVQERLVHLSMMIL